MFRSSKPRSQLQDEKAELEYNQLYLLLFEILTGPVDVGFILSRHSYLFRMLKLWPNLVSSVTVNFKRVLGKEKDFIKFSRHL